MVKYDDWLGVCPYCARRTCRARRYGGLIDGTISTGSPSTAGTTALIVILCVGIPAAAAGVWCYRRRKAKQAEAQVSVASRGRVHSCVSCVSLSRCCSVLRA